MLFPWSGASESLRISGDLASGLYEAHELRCVGFLGTGAVTGSAFSSKYSLIPWPCLAFVQGQPAFLREQDFACRYPAR